MRDYGFSNVCLSVRHICVDQFYFETVISKSISVMEMYGLIWASCVCGKNVPHRWNGYFHVWLNIVLFIKYIGVCIYGKWFEVLIGVGKASGTCPKYVVLA